MPSGGPRFSGSLSVNTNSCHVSSYPLNDGHYPCRVAMLGWLGVATTEPFAGGKGAMGQIAW